MDWEEIEWVEVFGGFGMGIGFRIENIFSFKSKFFVEFVSRSCRSYKMLSDFSTWSGSAITGEAESETGEEVKIRT